MIIIIKSWSTFHYDIYYYQEYIQINALWFNQRFCSNEATLHVSHKTHSTAGVPAFTHLFQASTNTSGARSNSHLLTKWPTSCSTHNWHTWRCRACSIWVWPVFFTHLRTFAAKRFIVIQSPTIYGLPCISWNIWIHL